MKRQCFHVNDLKKTFFGVIWDKFNVMIKNTKTAPCRGTIWDEFSEQRQHQIKAHKVQI